MITREVNTPVHTIPVSRRRFNITISGLAIRLLIAFVVSWLIVLAFFASGVVSH